MPRDSDDEQPVPEENDERDELDDETDDDMAALIGILSV